MGRIEAEAFAQQTKGTRIEHGRDGCLVAPPGLGAAGSEYELGSQMAFALDSDEGDLCEVWHESAGDQPHLLVAGEQQLLGDHRASSTSWLWHAVSMNTKSMPAQHTSGHHHPSVCEGTCA